MSVNNSIIQYNSYNSYNYYNPYNPLYFCRLFTTKNPACGGGAFFVSMKHQAFFTFTAFLPLSSSEISKDTLSLLAIGSNRPVW